MSRLTTKQRRAARRRRDAINWAAFQNSRFYYYGPSVRFWADPERHRLSSEGEQVLLDAWNRIAPVAERM